MNDDQQRMSDDQLVREAIQGDSEAFGQIYDRYAQRLALLLRPYTDDNSQVEDLVHETFCRLMDAIPSYRPRGKFRSWIVTIALNVGRKEARRRRNESRSHRLDSMDALRNPAHGDPHELLERERFAEALVRSLPETRRLVVVLRYWLDYTYDEIASCLGIPAGTARRRMHTALKELRHLIQQENEKEDAHAR